MPRHPAKNAGFTSDGNIGAKPARAKKKAPTPAQNRKKQEKLNTIGDKLGLWRPAVDVLRKVSGIATRFPQIDSITGIGGWPIERVSVVHGPSNEGKTLLVLGLGQSFLEAGGYFGLVDVELTTPEPWLATLMGDQRFNPKFVAIRPTTFEEAVLAARQFGAMVEAERARTKNPNLTGLFAVDSMRKLNPKGLLDSMMKQAAAGEGDAKPRGRFGKAPPKGIDGAGGRAAQIKAAMNAQWLDELVPLAMRSGIAVLLIARELGDDDDPFVQPTVGGGKSLNYDASLRVRVTRSAVLTVDGGSDGKKMMIGEKHAVSIMKTKVAGKRERHPTAYFHTANGATEDTREGFDRPRDVLKLAEKLGVVSLSGSWYAFDKKRLGQGEETAIHKLWKEPELCREIEAATRARFVLEGEHADRSVG